ncbi:Tn7-like element transposition protein TnsE [Maridesulfovibrio sp. FT414]|uniref:Tn7-like element transposition protein TnsE n=1 Tax=Maridesulfovibrio sp. FT414 TaxID=2979469 RepID=UPI003D806181
MSEDLVFNGVDPDACIESIGLLFKHNNRIRWGVNLRFHPPQDKQSFTVSYAPVLARKRKLSTANDHKLRGWSEDFVIDSTVPWRVCQIKDCPIGGLNKEYRDQFCFVFQLRDGKTIYLPQFELARVLFFRDGYLARTALDSDCLEVDFNAEIDLESGKGLIEIMPTAGYPLKNFNSLESRNYLSWILLDKQARKSYESIGLNQKKYGYQSGHYRMWNFRFDPPELPGAYFDVRGQFDKKTKAMFVYEIAALESIKADIPDEIDMHHLEFTTPSNERNRNGSPVAPTGEVEGVCLHDDEEANAERSRLILQGDKVKSAFSKPFITNRVAQKKRKVSSVAVDEGEGESHFIDVSAEEPTAGPGRAGADWNITHDLTENAHLFENKFSCFLDMVKVMASYDGCEMESKVIHKLPPISNCSKHRLSTDGNPRCMAVIDLQIEGKFVTLLEVDTSDAVKALSTKVLLPRTYSTWDDDLNKIMFGLVRSSLVWPSSILTHICGSGRHIGIKHPQSAGGHRGLLLPDTIEGWAARFYVRIQELLGF